jgi:Flp pilus assembly protein RcpC/CpaB
MTGGSPPVLRIGWGRSWIPPHVRRRILAALLAGAGVLLALSSLQRPAAPAHVAVATPDRALGASGQSPGGVVTAGLAPGLVAAPVRLADADVAPLLHPGARFDVLAAGAASDPGYEAASAVATVVARDVQVLSVGPESTTAASSTNTSGGTLVVLAVTRSDARALAGGEAAGRLSVSLLGS